MTIVPDDKNWTWVIERPCPDCGFDPAAVERGQTGRTVRAMSAAWREVLGRPAAAVRPAPAVWSPLEYACHVRDVCRVFDARLARMLTEQHPSFENWDQDATAVEDRYGEQDPAAVATELVADAERLADRFDSVVGDRWARTSERSDGSRFTVESFATYLLHDLVHHLWDVGEPFTEAPVTSG